MPVSYSFSNRWADYSSLLRKYTLDTLLKHLNWLSYEVLKQGKENETFGVAMKECSLINSRTGRQEQQPVVITGWGLIDLAYHAILATNDYRGKPVENINELYALCLADNSYLQEEEKPLIHEIAQKLELLFYVEGFAGEQMKIERLDRVFDNAARELYMLFEIAPKLNLIDVGEIVQKETGVTWPVLCASLYLAWFGFTQEATLENMKKMIVWDKEFSLEDFERVLARYTATYDEVKKSALKRQVLYTKPYIKTKRGELISVSCFLNLFIYEHCILWAVRDHFLKQNNQQFTAIFGAIFEEYFHELLSTYLPQACFQRISEVEGAKRADWRFEICGFTFLIEQKSSLLQLAAKQQQSDYEAIGHFAKKTILKAMKQLAATEAEEVGKPCIKVILLYDDYLGSDIIDHVFAMEECDIKNDERYWIASIETMERFLSLACRNSEKCKEIIQKKIQLDKEHSISGKSLYFLLNDEMKNEYLSKDKMTYYRDYAQLFCRKRLPQRE